MAPPTPEGLLELWKAISAPQLSPSGVAEGLARGVTRLLGDVGVVRFRLPPPDGAKWEAVRVGPGPPELVRTEVGGPQGSSAETAWLEAAKVDMGQLADVLVFPLAVSGDVLGTLAVGRSRQGAGGAPFTPAEKALAQQIAECGAGALDGALVRLRDRWMRQWFDSCPSIIFYKTESLKYLFINEHYLKFTVHSKEKVLASTDVDLFPPQVAAFFGTVDRQILKSGDEAITTDKIVVHGDMKVHLALKFPIKDEAGNVVGVGGNITRVPDTKISNEALKAGEEQINFVTDPLPGLVSYFAVDQRIKFANLLHEEWLGIPRLDIINKSLKEVFGEAVYAEMRPQVELALKGERCQFDLEFRHADGTVRQTRVTYAPQRSLLREVEGVVALIVDETDQKVADDRLRFLAETGSLFGSSLETASIVKTIASLTVPRLADWCAVELRSPDGRREHLVVSHVDSTKVEQVRQLHGWLSEENRPLQLARVLRTGWPELAPEITDEKLAELVPDLEVRRLIQEVGLSSAMVVPINTRTGTIGAITLVSLKTRRRFEQADLTHAEELARRAGLAVDNAQLYREVQAAVRLRDEFLAVASHELRTPLAALSLHLDTLLIEAKALSKGVPALAHFQDSLRRSMNHSERLGGLIRQLLDVSRIQMGKLELQLELVDLGKVVEEVVGRFAEQAAQAQCQLKVDIQPQPIVGYWDPLQLDQVTTNLLSNALKYGAGKPIEVTVSAVGGKAALTVKDHGIGISPTDQERIFGRFERAVSQRHYGGLGLGLWITRQSLEAMGGSIKVHSTPNVETRFVAELPLRTGP